MDMNKLICDLDELRKEEYARAAKKHGQYFHSTHEAAAVIREELDEAKDALGIMEATFDGLWRIVKLDFPIGEQLEGLGNAALEAAAECIQVAAMCYKGWETGAAFLAKNCVPTESGKSN